MLDHAVLLVAAAALTAVAFRAALDRPPLLFMGAWLSLVLTGAVLWLPAGPGPVAVSFLSPVFPAAQLAGVLALLYGRAPGALAAAAIAVGMLRAALAARVPALELWIGITVEPATSLAAAAILAHRARRDGAPRAWYAAAIVIALAGVTDGVSAALRSHEGTIPILLAVGWIVLASVGLPIQLQLQARRDQQRQTGLRRRAEAELEETRERFRALTESAFDLVAELDGSERFTYVNPKYEELLGYPRASMIGLQPVDFLHPDDVPAAKRFAEEASSAGSVSGLVVRARRRDGSYVWIESAARGFVTPDGARRWVMNTRDVTDRRAREVWSERAREELELAVSERTAQLDASEARFRALADHAPELISEFDAYGRYIFANASFRDLLGRDPATLLGTEPEALMHPDDLETSRASMVRALIERSTARAVHRLRHADGSWRWFDNTGRAYLTARGKLRFVSMGRDVTEARQAEADRVRLEARMQEVQRLESLGVLAGGIAHDFNNLLAVIVGNAVLLESGGGTAEDQKNRIRRIRAAGRHAEALTDQMLTYAGKSVAERVPLDLSALVRETEDLLRASIAKSSRLELDLESGLPAVLGDATRLRQVLLNLVTNASEALGEAPGQVRVRTATIEADSALLASALGGAAGREGKWLLLEVRDDGPGMPAEVRRRVFEPFFSTKGPGRGLGLAAVLGIASSHGGALDLDEAPGGGTVVRLYLPPSGTVRVAPAPPALARPAEPATGLVLVVDDDDAVREIAQALLEQEGLRVETAPGGEEALERVRKGGVDVVLLDLAMPDLPGQDVLRAMNRAWPELPVIVASGYKGDLAAERLGAHGAFAVAQKPFDAEALGAVVRAALASRARSG
jgi:two-component system cell cycle sensor histidine kinase/response regulator CckA